jgi:hypothetical protein
MDTPSKPGWQTTEFWISLVTLVCATVLVAMGKIDSGVWAAAAGVSSAGYALSRGLAKGGPGTGI